MSNKKKSKNIDNPEILREEEEKRKSQAYYDDDDRFGSMLYPGILLGATASVTESTGLIQVIPTPDMMDVFDDVYSYRRTKPAVNKDEN